MQNTPATSVCTHDVNNLRHNNAKMKNVKLPFPAKPDSSIYKSLLLDYFCKARGQFRFDILAYIFEYSLNNCSFFTINP